MESIIIMEMDFHATDADAELTGAVHGIVSVIELQQHLQQVVKQQLEDVNKEKLHANLLSLVEMFIKIAKEEKQNTYLINFLIKAKNELEHYSDEPYQAKKVYQNINTLILVNKITLTKKEKEILTAIYKISISNGWVGGLNTWNTTNSWPSNL